MKLAKETILKIIGYTGVALIVLNFLFFIFRIYSPLYFWIVLIAVSVLSFGAIRILKGKSEKKKK